jgi:hypothetical protein
MPEASQEPAAPVTFGPCPKCQYPLRLVLVEPVYADNPDRENRMFRCDACEHSEIKTVKYR